MLVRSSLCLPSGVHVNPFWGCVPVSKSQGDRSPPQVGQALPSSEAVAPFPAPWAVQGSLLSTPLLVWPGPLISALLMYVVLSVPLTKCRLIAHGSVYSNVTKFRKAPISSFITFSNVWIKLMLVNYLIFNSIIKHNYFLKYLSLSLIFPLLNQMPSLRR